MPEDENAQSKLTVGGLLGLPLGAMPTPSTPETETPKIEKTAAEVAPQQRRVPSALVTTTEEKPWTLADGSLRQQWNGPQFNVDGVEAITYNNVFDQAIEQVWFDGKLVYALDVGDIEVDPQQVKVAQEYEIVYSVELDERGKTRAEPPRVPGQLNIYDSVPGMEKYSPIWQFNYVVVPADYRANTLRSESDCLASGYPIHRTQVFEN